ncbi:MAG: HAD family hydrolase [Planctomycetota bacterium]|nr:MAG: HAD family hydrolase [Planctomycetota bacterium]REJ95933.1 MAG: HAD family hydrolase [Planctomycetota bacterium]REK29248.1 MAG: HAD family hydrolase [Planctomycetota bacterium]REK29432.1 MAG: HAD family hydrolase [Planctomycetota bacterium]
MRDWPEQVTRRHHAAVFLDRDGTINVDTHFPHRIDELAFENRALEGLARLAPLPLHIIVVSNQAGIARGLFTVDDMSAFNQEILRQVQEVEGRIDALYYCPHPERKDLPHGAQPCRCSKPNPGMLEEAAADFGLDLKQCFLIGDKNSDIAAAQAVGATPVLLETGKAGGDECELVRPPSARLPDLSAAAAWVHSRFETNVLEYSKTVFAN